MMKQPYGTTSDGAPVDAYTLTQPGGLSVQILTYGGIIAAFNAPDRQGNYKNIVLGFDNLPDYETRSPFFGCITGRVANRIARGRYTLDGTTYQVAVNDGPNSLHGGLRGFNRQVWEVTGAGDDHLALHYLSPDGEENFPGSLDVTVTYTLTADSGLRIDYQAETDRPTLVNLTNHTYWNLAGEGEGSVYHHSLRLNADRFTPVDQTLIPTGELAPVAGTPLDLRQPRAIADGLRTYHPQMAVARGYDHNWVLNRPDLNDAELILAAELVEPLSGRRLETWTTEPGIQVYSGNFLDGSLYGTSHRAYRQGDGLALETQHFPDSPNQPNFPSIVLRPGAVYRSTTVYKASAA